MTGAGLTVLVLTPWFPPAPGAREGSFVLDQVRALAAAGARITVFVGLPWVPAPLRPWVPAWKRGVALDGYRDEPFGVALARYPSLPRDMLGPAAWPLMAARLAPAVRRIAEEGRIALIHAHTEAMGYVAARVGLPSVLTLHGVNPSLGPARRRQLAATFTRVRRVVLVGSPLRRHVEPMVARGDARRFLVVANGFQVPVDLEPSGRIPRRQRFRIVSVSNLHPNKGVDLTIRALADLAAQGLDDLECVIVGDGAERAALEALVGTLGLTGRVHFTGYLPQREALAEIAAGDVFCLPSWREAAGIAYLEAMALGKVAIGCRWQGPEDFIVHEQTGYLVEPHHAAAVAAALRAILTDWDRARLLGARAREHVWTHFTWSHNATRMLQVYRDALAPPT